MSVKRRESPPRVFYRVFGGHYRDLGTMREYESAMYDILKKELENIISRNENDEETVRILKTCTNKFKRSIARINQVYDRLDRYRRATGRGYLGSTVTTKEANAGDNLSPHQNSSSFKDELDLPLDRDIVPNLPYPKIPNYVVIAHLGKGKNDLEVDQRRIALYIPNSLRTVNFAATIFPQDGATALFYSNGKTVLTGTTALDNALFALQMYRMTLSRVKQQVVVRKEVEFKYETEKGEKIKQQITEERHEVSYLKNILGFNWFSGTNAVGNGPLTKPGETVDLSMIAEKYPDTNWNPEIFPGLKYHLPEGNSIIEGGKKCTAHIFEGKIVIMGLENPKDMTQAYRFFLEFVKPFTCRSSKEYEEDRYCYRYNKLLHKKNSNEESKNQGSMSSLSSSVSSVNLVVDEQTDKSSPDFDIKNCFTPELLKKIQANMRVGGFITKGKSSRW
jgi:TATA-box binding protein (TBP) (component of TFIID and TFIIIB)